MTFTQVLVDGWATFLAHVEKPAWLVAIPILIFLLFLILRHDFVKLAEDRATKWMRRRQQIAILLFRSLAIIALVLAIASPFMERQRTVSGDPFLKILADNSQSMNLYPSNTADNLKARLEQAINVEMHSIASGTSSPLGDSILNTVREGDNVVLVTDGQATSGASLGDVALFAVTHNITFNAITLVTNDDDGWIKIDGPDKTVANVDNTFTVTVAWASKAKKPISASLLIDGKLKQEFTEPGVYTITEKFSEGFHRLEARITETDKVPENNIYYKTIKVVQKPKIALWSQVTNSPIENLLRQVYDVTTTSTLPLDLEPYYAVVTNDLYGSSISDDDVTRLGDYLQDGNGLVAVGGQGSYDKGAYKSSFFETLLPVVVGTPGKEAGDVNIVVLIDASLSVSSDEGGGIFSSKQLALDIIRQMSPNVKLGITAFRNIAFTVSPMGYKSDLIGLENKLAAIYGSGSSKMHLGIAQSIDLLKGTHGSKNIIIISDGMLFPNDQQAAKDAVLMARKNGIKVYTVGVAVGDATFVADRVDEDVMKSLAALSGGVYFKASDRSRFTLLFGDVKKPEAEKAQEWGVNVLDSNHFITDGIETNATIFGFNAVAPKTTGRTLVVTSTGEPILTTWRLGLGRVAAYSTDDGSAWAGEMLSSANSKLLIRSMNWVNGDPDRKRSNFVDIKDTRVNEPTELTIKAATQPTAQGIGFFKIRPDTYQADITPKETGFHEILGATYAANYPAESGPLGMSKELEQLVRGTGGQFYAADAADQLVQFAQSHAVKEMKVKDYFRWHLAVIAAILFLIEVFLRRMMRR